MLTLMFEYTELAVMSRPIRASLATILLVSGLHTALVAFPDKPMRGPEVRDLSN